MRKRWKRAAAAGTMIVTAGAGCGGIAGGGTPDAGPPSSPAASSSDRARAVLARGLDALGGPGVLERAGGIVVEGQGTYDLGVRLQGMRPGQGDRYPMSERLGVVPGERRTVYESRGWVNPDAEEWIRHDIRPREGYWIDLLSRRAFRAGRGDAGRYARTIPHVLLEEALGSGAAVRWLGPVDSGGVTREAVEYVTPDGEPLTLLFDPGTGRLREAEYAADLPLRGRTRVRWSWGEYRTVTGIGPYPSSYAVDLGDERLREVAFTRVAPAPGSDLFDVPPDITLPAPQPPVPAQTDASGAQEPEDEAERYDIRELAPGVHLFVSLRGGFHMLFVEFEDHVLAVDAPAGWNELHQLPPAGVGTARAEALGERYLAGIRSVVPGKPVRYVVLTHAHSDHAGGVPAFVRAGATVLGTETTRGPVERLVARAAGRAGGGAVPPLRFETVRGERVLRDDSMEVRILDVGANPHAEGMLAVFLPRERLLYVSDLFEPLSPANFPAPARVPVMRWFVDWLDRSGLEPARIFAVHGSARVTDEQLQRIRELTTAP